MKAHAIQAITETFNSETHELAEARRLFAHEAIHEGSFTSIRDLEQAI